MDPKTFKAIFNEVVKAHGFDKAHGGWFKDSGECMAVLDLQRSNYGVYFELNIKIYIQGMFGASYFRDKQLVKKDIGHVFTRQPNRYKDLFDLENEMEEALRQERLGVFFDEFLVPFTDLALTKQGLVQLADEKRILLMPAVEKGLAVLLDGL
jgi:hypothetical protein